MKPDSSFSIEKTDITPVEGGSSRMLPGVTCEEQLDEDDDDLTTIVHPSPKRQRSAESIGYKETVVTSPGQSNDRNSTPGVRDSKDSAVVVKATAVYDTEIWNNLLLKEQQVQSPWGYIGSSQKNLLPDHRRIMVNWLVEFAEEFELQCETLSLGVNILDRVLADGPPVQTGDLQLLGTACMLVAVKFQESQPPNMVQCCCQAAEGSFTQEQVLQKEFDVLKTIKFDCAIPTVHTFLWHHLKAVDADAKLEQMADYIACSSLLEYDLLKYHPSAISAATVKLAASLLEGTSWTSSMELLAGYSASGVKDIIKILQQELLAPPKPSLTALKTKFEREQHFDVASLLHDCIGSICPTRLPNGSGTV
ncbi:hypothetical protein CLOM_g14110 [Closterium sp. NIES-68]|nr:hypothetical protein CLOM_g14110 [Closterium sp. NIES-68]GJP59114.1 hypothetical protein CLOP_g8012 [Closterium sp. NIES-67]